MRSYEWGPEGFGRYGLVYRFPFFTQLIRFGLDNERGVGHVASQTGLNRSLQDTKEMPFSIDPFECVRPGIFKS